MSNKKQTKQVNIGVDGYQRTKEVDEQIRHTEIIEEKILLAEENKPTSSTSSTTDEDKDKIDNHKNEEQINHIGDNNVKTGGENNKNISIEGIL